MARLIVIIPLLLLVGAKLFTWWAKRRTAALEQRVTGLRPGARRLDPAAFGLPARTDLDTTRNRPPGPDAEALARIAAEGTDDWRPFAARLTPAGDGAGLRGRRIDELAGHAAKDDGWLRAWRTAEPASPDAAIVHAAALVQLAWEVRSGLRAEHVTREQFDAFHRILREAVDAFDEAARLAPDDVAPWEGRLPIAMGLGWSHEEFGKAWQEVVTRSPYHHVAHRTALQYWCRKWRGSHELMFGFAEQAAAGAPPESLLSGLYLIALHEYELTRDDYGAWRTPEARHAVDRVLADLRTVPAEDPRAPALRHLLAYALTHDRRWAEAVEQFRLVDRYIDSAPWSYSADPVDHFDKVRVLALTGWDAAGRPAPPQPTAQQTAAQQTAVP